MSIVLLNITKEDFLQSMYPIVFDDSGFNRRFAVVSNGTIGYRIAWGSTLIDPIIVELEPSIFGLGVDQHFAILDFSRNRIVAVLQLDYNLSMILSLLDSVFVVTEQKILRLSKSDYRVLKEYDTPDIVEDVESVGDKLVVTCLNGKEMSIDV